MDKATPFPWETDGETVTFETPEQTPIEYRVAPFGTRIVAALIDQLIIFAVTAALLILSLLALFLSLSVPLVATYIAAFLVAFHFLFSIFYFVWGELRGEGQTIGKRRFDVRVLLATGQGVTFGASLVRNLARVVDNVPLLWVVPAFTRGRRRLGDLLAGTVVVAVGERASRARRRLEWLAPSYAQLADRQFYFSTEQTEKLFPDDLNLLEHLEERLPALTGARRRQVLEEVARRYASRLEMTDEENRIVENPRRFLQELALFLRDRFEGQAY